jgi:ABC-type antimicrobial peptide transport system permease subunit
MGIILTQNAAYQQELDFGYDLRKVAVTTVNNPQEYTGFYNEVLQNSVIKNAAGSSQIVGESNEIVIKKSPDDVEKKSRKLEIGSNYLNTLGIKLVVGRDFIAGSIQDQENSIIVNQKLLEELQWKDNPINKQIYIEEKAYTIIGVAQNHKELGLLAEEPACIFKLSHPDQFKYISVNVPFDKIAELDHTLRETWSKVNPDVPYYGFLQEMLIFKQLYMNIMLRNLCIFLAGVTLIMSAAGFFSIVSLSVLKRTKEIGIRKVFGGSVKQMIQIISKGFLKLIVIAFVVGSLLGYLVIDKVLFTQMYAYHIPIGIGAFILTFFIVTLIPMLTVGFKVYQAATANPSETLKYE